MINIRDRIGSFLCSIDIHWQIKYDPPKKKWRVGSIVIQDLGYCSRCGKIHTQGWVTEKDNTVIFAHDFWKE